MELLKHPSKRDVIHPSMRDEVGKSFNQIQVPSITAYRAHGVTDKQNDEIVLRHRSPEKSGYKDNVSC